MIEELESRRFLSATLDQGVLRIIGTHLADRIDVTIPSNSPDTIVVTFNKTVTRFPARSLEAISVQAGQGNDRVAIDAGKSRLAVPSTIYGSGGNDTLLGGAGKDRIYGNDGRDSIDGGPGRDILYGGDDADSIRGGLGNDFIDGGLDNDTLDGGDGVDAINGGAGNDRLHARDQTVDSVNGGIGFDTADYDNVLDGLTSIEKRV